MSRVSRSMRFALKLFAISTSSVLSSCVEHFTDFCDWRGVSFFTSLTYINRTNIDIHALRQAARENEKKIYIEV